MSDTRVKLAELAAANPLWNLSDLARALGVSRERVRQLANDLGLGVPRGVTGYKPRAKRPVARAVGYLCETAKGTAGELLVAADLTTRGFAVFFPLVRTTRCDLIAMDGQGNLERIEVRCGRRRGGSLRVNRPTRKHFDRLAVVVAGEPIAYEPPIDVPLDSRNACLVPAGGA